MMGSIFACCERIFLSFNLLIQRLQDSTESDENKLDNAINQFRRFNVWAGSLGAKHPPHKRISLDYRLRDSQFYRDKVEGSLKTLNSSMQRVIHLVDTKDQRTNEIENLSDAESDGSSTASSTDAGQGGTTAAEPSALGRLQQLFQARPEPMTRQISAERIEDPRANQTSVQETVLILQQEIRNIVTHLYRISMIVRKPIGSDRLSRASKVEMAHFNLIDQRHVEECFPKASSALKNRLGVAVTRRRQLLKYNELHNDKASKGPSSNLPTRNMGQKDLHQYEQQVIPEQNTENQREESTDTPAKSVRASTEATKFIPPEIREDVEVRSESGTVSSFAFSASGGEIIRIPPRPRDETGEEPDQFLCPYCFHIVEITSHRSWVRHIFRDLQTYVCTFENCKTPNRLFETRNEWFNHELEQHRREWYCNTKDHPVFHDLRLFHNHMLCDHASQVTEANLHILSGICERPLTSGAVVCPLCSENQYDIVDGFQLHRGSSHVAIPDDFHQNTKEEAGLQLSQQHIQPSQPYDDTNLELHERVSLWVDNVKVHKPASPSTEGVEPEGLEPGQQELEDLEPEDVEPDHRDFIVDAANLKHHLAQHLERLALFTIPPTRMIDDADDSVNTAEAAKLSQSSSTSDDRSEIESSEDEEDNINAQILASISSVDTGLAIRTLQFLLFSKRPLQVPELADAIAVDAHGQPRFDPMRRLTDPSQILDLCSNLVHLTTTNVTGHSEQTGVQLDVLVFVHPSIKPHLRSTRLDRDLKPYFQVKKAEAWITKACLAYLLHLEQDLNSDQISALYPFAQYCAQFWIEHANAIGPNHREIQLLIVHFFLNSKKAYINCLLLYNPADTDGTNEVSPPLYYASFTGLTETVKLLLEKGCDANARGSRYGTAIHAASFQGNLEIVQLLIEKGADINVLSGRYGTALQAASLKGNLEIVQLLLDKGADVNAQGGPYGTALWIASFQGNLKIAQFLLEKGADVNLEDESHNTALQAASAQGYTEIVQLLLDKGADVNVLGRRYGTALQVAAERGNLKIAQLVLEKGADVNVEDNSHNTALQAASAQGHTEIVRLLLEKGAEANTRGGWLYGTALQAASKQGHTEIVQLLVEKGADVNVRDGKNDNALQAASKQGHEDIVQILRAFGAKEHDLQDEHQQLGQYFLPGDGIEREVVTQAITHFLGKDALVKPGTHQEVQGFWIRAYRNLTSSMVEDLKVHSQRFIAENRERTSRGESPIPYDQSSTFVQFKLDMYS